MKKTHEYYRGLTKRERLKANHQKHIENLFTRIKLNEAAKIHTYRITAERDHYIGTRIEKYSPMVNQEPLEHRHAAYILNLYRKEITSNELNDYDLAKEIHADLWFSKPDVYYQIRTEQITRIIRKERQKLAKYQKKDKKDGENILLPALVEQEYYNHKRLNKSEALPLMEHLQEHLKEQLALYTDKEKTVFLQEQVERIERNYYARRRRFIRKFYMLRPNYFITFTYDDEKLTEEEFVVKLRRCLVNLAERRDWLCIIVPEHGAEGGRKHFHVAARIPNGQMVGELYERNDYSTKHRKRIKTVSNTFFEKRFGRCDFKKIENFGIHCGTIAAYLIKYLAKDGNRMMYSRGIPTEIVLDMSEDDVAGNLIDGTGRVVFWDDAFHIPFNELCLHLKLGKLEPI